MKVVIPKLLTWYLENHRDLPWRRTSNPYYIWISEMILQQTRVEQGLPYYHRFIDKFPQITDLANASEQEVLNIWQGLGYYARARNLHKTAKIIAEQYLGAFPKTYPELLKLKGIGPYTAAAIGSFAFKIAVPAVDGNVKRVVARVYGLDTNTESPIFFKTAFSLLQDVIPSDRPDIFNQSTMELGATICTPQKPKCNQCPLQEACVAFATQQTDSLPVRIKKIKVTQRNTHFCVFEFDNKFLIRQRPSEGIWGGLYEFVNFDSTGEAVLEFPKKECPLNVNFDRATLQFSTLHKLSHQHIKANFWHIQLDEISGLEGLGIWVEFDQLKSFPLHKLMRNFVSL